MSAIRYLVAAVLLLVSSTLWADEMMKLGFVNIERVYREAAPAVAAQKKLEKEFSARKASLDQLAARGKALQADLDKTTLSDTDRRAKEREFASLDREFQSRQREFREDLTSRRNEEYASVLEQANRAVLDIAKQDHFDLILQDVVYVDPKYDITDRVLKALDRN